MMNSQKDKLFDIEYSKKFDKQLLKIDKKQAEIIENRKTDTNFNFENILYLFFRFFLIQTIVWQYAPRYVLFF